MSWLLNVKGPSGSKRVNAEPTETVKDFIFRLAKEFGQEPSLISLKMGFPPKKLTFSSATDQINSLGIANRETLILEQASAPNPLFIEASSS